MRSLYSARGSARVEARSLSFTPTNTNDEAAAAGGDDEPPTVSPRPSISGGRDHGDRPAGQRRLRVAVQPDQRPQRPMSLPSLLQYQVGRRAAFDGYCQQWVNLAGERIAYDPGALTAEACTPTRQIRARALRGLDRIRPVDLPKRKTPVKLGSGPHPSRTHFHYECEEPH